jgi:hypothetical protein
MQLEGLKPGDGFASILFNLVGAAPCAKLQKEHGLRNGAKVL